MQLVYATESLLFDVEEYDNILNLDFVPDERNDQPIYMNWGVFRKLEEQNRCVTFTARNGRDKLLGFVIYIVYNHLHYKDTMIATCDTLCVDPEFRGHGIATGMMKFAEPKLIDYCATKIIHMSRHMPDTSGMFIKQGYSIIETAFCKTVG